MIPRSCFKLMTLLVLLNSGCQREGIRVYTAPKDPPIVEQGHEGHGHGPGEHGQEPPAAERARPQITWKLPEGWKETAPSQVSVAQFVISGAGGECTVNITPLPNLAGKEALVVNMWREQVGQKPLEQNQLESALTEVAVAGGRGQLFEITGNREGTPSRIVTAMFHQPDSSWFFKLSGPDATAAALKPAFLEFIQSVRLGPTP